MTSNNAVGKILPDLSAKEFMQAATSILKERLPIKWDRYQLDLASNEPSVFGCRGDICATLALTSFDELGDLMGISEQNCRLVANPGKISAHLWVKGLADWISLIEQGFISFNGSGFVIPHDLTRADEFLQLRDDRSLRSILEGKKN